MTKFKGEILEGLLGRKRCQPGIRGIIIKEMSL
jgi:hypothetical protein